MSYLSIYNLAHDDAFRRRVQTAALIVGRDILNDGADDQTGPRYTLARQAARLDDPVVDQFAWEAALKPAIATAEEASPGSCQDGDLGFVCSTVWDRIAGAA